ncbi:hypothetical protein FOL47_003915 [Perkinsus chesapeaki]|uniref:4-hydroxyphenylpyruvate dioxygenase n=1 Tax=Perkinsus chesapeaki TaxID=330153 RepID=A0A7J6M5P1_PERCH|nr:hypothetical protein FOL47_003915 [Perkinsus chesapeaki]
MRRSPRLIQTSFEDKPSKESNTFNKVKGNKETVWAIVKELRAVRDAPVDTMGCHMLTDPKGKPDDRRYQLLVAAMLSSQTKDQENAKAMGNLHKCLKDKGGLTRYNVASMTEKEIDEQIKGVGFHNTKAKNIKKVAEILLEQFDGKVPDTMEGLMSLPGVGPKMAVLMMEIGHGRRDAGICVDTHVHRIATKLGWTKNAGSPEATRQQLESCLPVEVWSDVNLFLVGLGQMVQQRPFQLLVRCMESSDPIGALQLVNRIGCKLTVIDKATGESILDMAEERGCSDEVKDYLMAHGGVRKGQHSSPSRKRKSEEDESLEGAKNSGQATIKTTIVAGTGDPYMANPGAKIFPDATNLTGVTGTSYLEFWVGNAKQSAIYYMHCLGFQPVAYSGMETGNKDKASYILRQGDINIMLSSPLQMGGEMNDFINKHGDGIRNIALACPNAKKAHDSAVSRGAKSFQEVKTLEDEYGKVRISGIDTYGEVKHLFLERGEYKGDNIMPGFEVWDPGFKVDDVGLKYVDHMVGNVGWNEMDVWAKFYKNVFGMDQLISFDDKDISTDYTALKSKVMTVDTGLVKYPINEPAVGKKKSQIEEYLEFNNGPGVQHLALATEDIIHTVSTMRARGTSFLKVPDTYYENLEDRVGPIEEDVAVLKDLGILVDRDDKGYLLQIFTRPLTDRPTFFIEIIQRRGGFSFGKGNFKALFVSIEEEQKRRGTLWRGLREGEILHMSTRIVGSLRDKDGDLALRIEEEKARIKHFNAAIDIQLLREQPFDIITNASRLQGLTGDHPMTLTYKRPGVGRSSMPSTLVDYNILSNLSHDVHHWANPKDRPKGDDGSGVRKGERLVPSYTEKDYNIITTKYLYDHEKQAEKEASLQKAFAAAKYRARNRFDPVLQRFTDPREEDSMKRVSEAMDVERVERALAQQPPCVRGRLGNFWNPVSHEVNNSEALEVMDIAADERKERYKNRYIMENNWHPATARQVRDVSRGHVEKSRRMNGISHDRFAEEYRRGFDIVSNVDHRLSQPSLPYPKPRPTAWDRIAEIKSDELAETMLMATTAMPPLEREEIRIPKATIESGMISSLQLEAVAYAARKFRLDKEAGRPSGFCLGDGTGPYSFGYLMGTLAMYVPLPLSTENASISWSRKCGKGRVIAALMLHLWNMGYRRLCWITATPDLLQDARRDLQDLGAANIPLLDYRKVRRYGTSIADWKPPRGRGRPRKESNEAKPAKKARIGKGECEVEGKVEGGDTEEPSSPCTSHSSHKGNERKKHHRHKEGKHHHHHHKEEEASVSKTSRRKRKKQSEGASVGVKADEWKGEGILFAAYAILVTTPQKAKEGTKGKSRYEQLLEWLNGGNGFVCLDECHKAKNVKVSGRKGSSRTGDLILELSRKLPEHPFLYCSATVAADIDNLAYLERLGMWGPHTPFHDFEAFHSVAKLGGTSGMEALAAEMKARGTMVARCLSFKGTTFHVDKVALTNAQIRLYDQCSNLWQDIISLPSGSLAGMALYSSAQRFFKILLLSFKLPAAVQWANEALLKGKSVVFSIWTTMESRLNAAAAGMDEDEATDKMELGGERLGPRSLLEYTIKKHLGDKDPVLCEMYIAEAAKLELPSNPLDDLIDLMGGPTKVAELTGRTKRQETDSSGKTRLVARQTTRTGDNINVIEQQAFQRGDKLVAVISEAASAGISLHADARAQSGGRQRVMIALELPWSAEKTVQQLGRVHRTNQRSPPSYILLVTTLLGELRFVSAVARRLVRLGALTRGDRNSAIGVEKVTSAETPATSSSEVDSNPSTPCSPGTPIDEADEACVTSPAASSAFGAFDYYLPAVRLALRKIQFVLIAGPEYESEDGTWPHEEDLPRQVWESPGPWTSSSRDFLRIVCAAAESAGLTSSQQARALDSSAPSETVSAFNLFLNRCLIQPVEIQDALLKWFSYHYSEQYDALKREDDLLTYGSGGKGASSGIGSSIEVVESELLCAGNGPETHLLTLSSDVGTPYGLVYDRYLNSYNGNGGGGASSRSLATARGSKRCGLSLQSVGSDAGDAGIPEGFYEYEPLPPSEPGLGFALRLSTSGRRPTFIFIRPDLPNKLLRRPRELLSSRKPPRLKYRSFADIDECQREWERAYTNRRPVCQHMVTGAIFSLWALLESLMVDGIPDPQELARLTRSLKLRSVEASGKPVVGLVLNDSDAAHRAQELALALRDISTESEETSSPSTQHEPDALEALLGPGSPLVKVPKIITPDFDSPEGQDLAVQMAAHMCSLDTSLIVGSVFRTWLDVHAYLCGKNGCGVRLVSNDIDGMVFVRRWLQKLFTRGYVHRGEKGIVFDRLSPS